MIATAPPSRPAGPQQPRSAAPAPDEAQRRAALVRMKRLASGLLLLATAIFIVATWLEPRWPWLAFVRATAEASMVGGLADWFAVTALFRHPLGLPIPHTAIIPSRKDRVGRSLGGFVQRNFLSRDVIAGKLATARIAEHLARWLADPANAALVAQKAARAVAAGVQMLDDEHVQEILDRNLVKRVQETQVAPLLSKALEVVTEDGRHQELLDGAIRLVSRLVTENQDTIRDRIEAESPWWIPGAVDEKIHEKIVGGIERTLREVRDDPDHRLRQRFDTFIEEFIERLRHSPEMQARAERLKADMLSADVIRRFSSSVWSDAKEALVRYAERPQSFSPGTIERGLTTLAETVLADPEMMAKAEGAIVDVALHLVDRYQDEVGQLIATTVEGWDAEATSQRIELAVGKDLQYVRINGTLVGGLAGLALYTALRLLGKA